MEQNERLVMAGSQLDRILGFFGRVDGKASALFAVNTALIAVLGLNIRPSELFIWYVVLPGALAFILLIASHYFIYRCAFPSLKGGHKSLIYFREIANYREAKFIDEFMAADHETLTKDVLGQVWRNSEILKIKFDSIKVAYILTAISLLPWIIFLVTIAILYDQLPSFR